MLPHRKPSHNEHFFCFRSESCAPQPATHSTRKPCIVMEFRKRQRFDLDDDDDSLLQKDSMDCNYDSGVGDSILSSSFGGGIGGGIGAPILSSYLSRGPSCEYEEATERKRKAAVAFFAAATGSPAAAEFAATAKVGRKTKLTAASFLFPPQPPPPPPLPPLPSPTTAAGSDCPTVVDISNETDSSLISAAKPSASAKSNARKVAAATKRVKANKKLSAASSAFEQQNAQQMNASLPSQSSLLTPPPPPPPSTPNESNVPADAVADTTSASVITPAVVVQTVKKIVDYTSETEQLFLVSARNVAKAAMTNPRATRLI